jgi:hypothetical protein
MLSHKHIPYGKIKTTMKDADTLTEHLLDEICQDAEADFLSKIPPLNPEDPLSGLTDEQVKESLATYGKNEVSVDRGVGIIDYCVYAACCYCFSFAHSCVHASCPFLDHHPRNTALETIPQAVRRIPPPSHRTRCHRLNCRRRLHRFWNHSSHAPHQRLPRLP